MIRHRARQALTAASLSIALASASGCGNAKKSLNGSVDESNAEAGRTFAGDDAGSGSGQGVGTGGGGGVFQSAADAGSVAGNTCAVGGGLACDVPKGCTTSLSGTVYDPAGRNPIYNAVVFVPTDPAGKLPPITPGTHTCSSCDVSIGDYVTATVTDTKGHFTLTGVPAVSNLPLVVQIGKWRREVFLPSVKACTMTTLADKAIRLPKKKSEGDMPQMAILTGGADQLGCFMAQLGIDPVEFTSPHAGGRLDVYQGVGGSGVTGGTAGNCQNSSCPLWATKADLESYDIAVLACEGGEHGETKTMGEIQNLHDWLNEGGKVFATHFHYVWFKNGPADFANAATWLGASAGFGMGQFNIDVTFPKGKVLHDWLANVGALTGNMIQLNGVAQSVSTVNSPTQRWIYDTSNNVKYLSLLTPVNGAPVVADGGEGTKSYCGKAVFSDLHAGGTSFFAADVPGSCANAALTPQEEALEFLFFDLSACVANESQPPPPPPPPAQPAK